MGREDRLFVSQFSEFRHRLYKLTARSTALGVREQLPLWLLGSYSLRYPVVRRLRLMKCKSFSSEAAILQRILISIGLRRRLTRESSRSMSPRCRFKLTGNTRKRNRRATIRRRHYLSPLPLRFIISTP